MEILADLWKKKRKNNNNNKRKSHHMFPRNHIFSLYLFIYVLKLSSCNTLLPMVHHRTQQYKWRVQTLPRPVYWLLGKILHSTQIHWEVVTVVHSVSNQRHHCWQRITIWQQNKSSKCCNQIWKGGKKIQPLFSIYLWKQAHLLAHLFTLVTQKYSNISRFLSPAT